MPLDPPCPCGLPARLSACCGRWHAGPLHLQAPDAAALMRSRYSAYVLQRADYLLATWHAGSRPPGVDFEPGLRWVGLQLLQHVPAGDAATVTFIARSKLRGRAQQMRETSRFLRAQGRWCYVDGDVSGGSSGSADAS